MRSARGARGTGLTDGQVKLIIGMVTDGHSIPEAADLLGVSIGSVRHALRQSKAGKARPWIWREYCAAAQIRCDLCNAPLVYGRGVEERAAKEEDGLRFCSTDCQQRWHDGLGPLGEDE